MKTLTEIVTEITLEKRQARIEQLRKIDADFLIKQIETAPIEVKTKKYANSIIVKIWREKDLYILMPDEGILSKNFVFTFNVKTGKIGQRYNFLSLDK